MRSPRLFVLKLATLSLATAPLSAQSADPDPYTRHEPPALHRAGVVALETFMWASDHSTRAIQSLMGYEPIRFLETAHFKLAVSLAPQAAPTAEPGRSRLRAELTALARKLPRVDPETKVLDGWLRAHLYASRLEALYTEFTTRFGIDAAALAAARPGSAYGVDYVGEGPYLGQRSKYLVLLCRDHSAVNAYLKNFYGLPAPRTASRHAVDGGAALLLAVAELMPDEDLRRDDALFAAVAYHGAHLLLDGYRHYWHDSPVWFEEGVAHWLRARFIPHAAHFAVRPRELPAEPAGRDWRLKVVARVSGACASTTDELFRLRNAAEMSFQDHLAAWSRIDFLLCERGALFPELARELKGPDPARVPPRPTDDDVRARQAPAVERVLGWTPKELDAAWSAWVLNKYRG